MEKLKYLTDSQKNELLKELQNLDSRSLYYINFIKTRNGYTYDIIPYWNRFSRANHSGYKTAPELIEIIDKKEVME